MISNFFFENSAVYEIMGIKYCIAEQATDVSMAHAVYMLDN